MKKNQKFVAELVVLLGLVAIFGFHSATVQAQAPQTPTSRQGSPDLYAWGRESSGGPGTFTNPDTSDWIPFTPKTGDVDVAGGVLDASHYIEKPSGMHGFLRDDNKGNFVFEDGTNITFLGGQLSIAYNNYPSKEHSEFLVKWMRRHGLNYARSHAFDLPNETQWDRLDYFLYQCKKEGIYVVLTPIYRTSFKIVAPDGNTVTVPNSVILFFNKNMEEAVRNLWKEFYTHKNPYTGLRYCDDPTLAAFELKNEDSTFWALDGIQRDQPVFWKEIQQQYAEFLKEKYKTTDALRKAWTLEGLPSALEANESIEQANVDLLNMWNWHIEQNDNHRKVRPRKSDQSEFLHLKLTSFYDRSYKFLREIGCKQAICGSNWRGYSYTQRHVFEADSRMDFTDQHDYFDHPQGGWWTKDAVFHNRSMLKTPQAGLVGLLAPRQVLNKPYTLSEWNIGAWNEHLMESIFTMAPIGLMQGWDGLLQFVLLPNSAPSDNQALGDQFFNVSYNPSVMLQYPTIARMWYRKDVQESEPVFIHRISPEQLNMPSNIPSKLMPEVFYATGGDILPKEDQYGHMLAVVGKIGIEFTKTTVPHYEKEGIRPYLNQEGKVVRSMTDQITWDWGQGYMLIDTPKTQGICGYVGGIPIAGKNVQFHTSTDYGMVALTTLDDESDIVNSKRLLLTALGRARNTGTKYGLAPDRAGGAAHRVSLAPEHRVAVLEVGTAPIITEPVKGKVVINLNNPESAKVFKLNDNGERIGEVKTVVNGGKLEIDLPGNHQSRFFEITLADDYQGFTVKETKIYDGNGKIFVPVGFNTLFMYQDPGGEKTIPGIAKTSANCIRMFWQDDKNVPLSVLDKAIGKSVDNQLVVIVGLWEATGKWQNIDKCIDYWLRDDVKNVVQKYEKYFILNIANEAGDGSVSEADWENKYIEAVKKLRDAGYRVPIMIDPANWGRGERYILNCGEKVLAADPMRNIIFSWHPWDINQPTSRYTKAIQESLDKKLCMIVGEFSCMGAVYEGVLDWKPLVEECNKHNIGWLPWSWSMNNDKHNIVDNFDVEQKTEFGKQVLIEMDKISVKSGVFSVNP